MRAEQWLPLISFHLAFTSYRNKHSTQIWPSL
jgi:hypothetical protein